MRFLCAMLMWLSVVCADEVHLPSGIEHSEYDRLLKTYVDEQGLVDYAAWKKSPEDLNALTRYLAQFSAKDNHAGGDERIAGLINAYNAFTLKRILDSYPTESIRLLDDPFDGKRHAIGGRNVSLDEIEHDTLRPLIGWKVHAVVVCAARSCPPLSRNAFLSESWDQQIKKRYTVWLGRKDLNEFSPERKRVKISKIFDWYAEDFEGDYSIERLLKTFAPEAEQSWLEKGSIRIRYKPYHWGLNDQSDLGKKYKHSFFKTLL